MEKLLYFRNVTAVASDIGIENSACFPASALLGMHPVSSESIRLTFNPIQRPSDTGVSGAADSAANLPLVDTIVLNVTENKCLEAMEGVTAAINGGPNSTGFIVIADDAADSSLGTQYVSGVTSCGLIVHNAAFTN